MGARVKELVNSFTLLYMNARLSVQTGANMITMLDCIKRVPALLEGIVDNAGTGFQDIFDTYDVKEMNEICLIGSGTSYNASLTARYFAEKASGLRVTAVLPNDFLYGYTVRNPKALYVFVSQTGTSSITGKALQYVKEHGFMSVGVSEKRDTPIASKAGSFLDMGCGKEEYGMRTIGYSTSVLTLMLLGARIGYERSHIGKQTLALYETQVREAARSIPGTIDHALEWMDRSRRRMMRSAFLAFTGVGSLYGVAMEASVKIWEAPQIPSGGYELDEGMHGPNYGYDDTHAVFVLNSGGFENEKALALARYMKNEHGNGYVIGAGAIDRNDLSFEPAGEEFACLQYASAIQVLMYRLAVDGGRDFSVTGIHSVMNSYFESHAQDSHI